MANCGPEGQTVSKSNFVAMGIKFENTAGPTGEQAVALRATSDLTAFYECSFDGFQDTLYAHTMRQYYRECAILGTVDFIFGNAAALFDRCSMVLRKSKNNAQAIVTAHSRMDPGQSSGFVIRNSSLLSAEGGGGALAGYLGRPWRAFARVVYISCHMGSVMKPDGWISWNGNTYNSTMFFAEFNSSGPGARLPRVSWALPGELPPADVPNYLPFDEGPFLPGNYSVDGATWFSSTHVPFDP
eukprot:jgi/Mesen1/1653/ME000135S00639